MTTEATMTRLQSVTGESAQPGFGIRTRRQALGLTGTKLAKLAQVSRVHLSEIESGRKEPSTEWLRRVELAMDRYEHETGQDEPEPAAAPEKPAVIRVEVQGVYGAKALVFEAPPENIAELEAMVDRVMRRLAREQGDSDA